MNGQSAAGNHEEVLFQDSHRSTYAIRELLLLFSETVAYRARATRRRITEKHGRKGPAGPRRDGTRTTWRADKTREKAREDDAECSEVVVPAQAQALPPALPG